MDEDEGPSCRNAGTCLSSDLEGRRACATVLSRSHEMSARTEVTIDKAVGREKPLRLNWRFEPLHLPLAPSRRSVRVFGTIIEVSALVGDNHATLGEQQRDIPQAESEHIVERHAVGNYLGRKAVAAVRIKGPGHPACLPKPAHSSPRQRDNAIRASFD
jgi:hypothetical protein